MVFFRLCSARFGLGPPRQEYGGGGEGSKATELALRGRILDQAQRFLLALVVHDPSRRAKCAEEVSRHGLSLGGERRQWLFDALTASVSVAGDIHASGTGGVAFAGDGGPAVAAGLAGSGEQQQLENGPVATGWGGPSAEALEVGGDVLLAEVRAAAPTGYFALWEKAAGAGGRAQGAGEAKGEEDDDDEERTLDWVFEKTEADRVARGTNTDLVLLEVVMVMLKEQVTRDG